MPKAKIKLRINRSNVVIFSNVYIVIITYRLVFFSYCYFIQCIHSNNNLQTSIFSFNLCLPRIYYYDRLAQVHFFFLNILRLSFSSVYLKYFFFLFNYSLVKEHFSFNNIRKIQYFHSDIKCQIKVKLTLINISNVSYFFNVPYK